MPYLSEALKRKSDKQTIFEKEQQRQIDHDQLEQVHEIEAQIAAKAKIDEKLASEAEAKQAMEDFIRALEEEEQVIPPGSVFVDQPVGQAQDAVVLDQVQPVKPQRRPPPKRNVEKDSDQSLDYN